MLFNFKVNKSNRTFRSLIGCALTATCILATSPALSLSYASELKGAGPNGEVIDLSKKPLQGQVLSVAVSVIPPFVNLQQQLSTPNGIDVEIIKEIQRRTGFQLRNDTFEIMPFSEMYPLGLQGKLDILAGSITLTKQRMTEMDSTIPYVTAPLALVANRGAGIKTFQDLSNKTLAVQKGTNMGALLKGLSNVSTYEVTSNFMTFYAVSRGLADALIMDKPVAEEYIRAWDKSQLVIVEDLPDSMSDFGILLKKNSPNNKYIQQAVIDMKNDGTIERIIKEQSKKK